MKIEDCKLKIYGFACGETILFFKSSLFILQYSIKTAGQPHKTDQPIYHLRFYRSFAVNSYNALWAVPSGDVPVSSALKLPVVVLKYQPVRPVAVAGVVAPSVTVAKSLNGFFGIA
jgi:hypothetical protein